MKKYLLFIAIFLGGCAYPFIFATPTKNSPINFEVVDNRPSVEKQFRPAPLEIPMRDPTHRYGDEQFTFDRVRTLAQNLAAAFPDTTSNAKLVVEKLEVHSYFPKTIADARSGAALAAISVPAAIGASAGHKTIALRDVMICHIVGTFDGNAFNVRREVPFENRGREPEKAVPEVLKLAFDEVVEQVQKRRELRK